jgi:hypothetical protein
VAGDDNRELLYRVLEFIADAMGESPSELPGLERRIVHVQLAMMFLNQACDDDDDKVRALVDEMLNAPSQIIRPAPRRQ